MSSSEKKEEKEEENPLKVELTKKYPELDEYCIEDLLKLWHSTKLPRHDAYSLMQRAR
jgi:hypothetical protein